MGLRELREAHMSIVRTTRLFSPAANYEFSVASGIRLRTTGLYSPAAHHESVVASGIRLRTS